MPPYCCTATFPKAVLSCPRQPAHRQQTYLDLSISGFKRVWDGSYDPEKGGMFLDSNRSGKNACINFPTVIAAMTLYKITGEAAYVPRQINDTTSFS